MVLLTPSAISVAVSSTVVCTFTFLLFLSGYVLQQQTVRSLQDALRRPPELKPTATLPRKFWQEEEDAYSLDRKKAKARIIEVVQSSPESIEQRILESLEVQQSEDEQPTQLIPATKSHPESEISVATILAPSSTPQAEPRLAYILALSTPHQICSALLFFKGQREHGLQTPSLILLYPSLWESDSTNPSHQTALDLMRFAQDSRHVILHPVEISSVWEGITVESQLLGGLQRNWVRWGIDRSIYLRSPGLALDISKLDSALSKSSLSKSWVPLASTPQDTPSVLLLSKEKNMLMVPRGVMRGLTVDAKTGGHDEHHSKEMEIEARLAGKKAGYVIFDEQELEHRRGEKEWYGGVFERYERGLKEVCAGTPFVKSDVDDRYDLKRGRGM
jgi:hypothetical protein